MAFKFPSTSSGSEGIGGDGAAGQPAKRRSSVERLLKKNSNKWEQQFHQQRYTAQRWPGLQKLDMRYKLTALGFL